MEIPGPIFTSGCAGAIAVEVYRIFAACQQGRPPKRMRQWEFWFSWIAVALFAGFVASTVYQLTDRVVALHIGISLPYMVKSIAQRQIQSDEPE